MSSMVDSSEASAIMGDSSDASAIVVTFLSGFLGVMLSCFFAYITPLMHFNGEIPEPTAFPGALAVLAFVLLLRHNLRVVFLDSTSAKNIRKVALRWAVIVLIPIAILGTISLSCFNMSIVIGTIVMIIYSALFLIFWIIIMAGMDSDDPKEMKKQLFHYGILPLFSDLIIMGFWIYYLFYLEDTIIDPTGLYFCAIVAGLLVLGEIREVYAKPFIERIKQVASFLI